MIISYPFSSIKVELFKNKVLFNLCFVFCQEKMLLINNCCSLQSTCGCCHCSALHRGAFFQFSFRRIYCYGSTKFIELTALNIFFSWRNRNIILDILQLKSKFVEKTCNPKTIFLPEMKIS